MLIQWFIFLETDCKIMLTIRKGGSTLEARERILTIRLLEKLGRYPQWCETLGIEGAERREIPESKEKTK